jgi:Ser/Thr protein kinase RdoA (MazF antagonist)
MNPDRPTLDDPDVQRLIQSIDPRAQALDLGGSMSLNAKLVSSGLVLRVHQPFVSRPRLLAVQDARRRLAGKGLIVPVALRWRGSTVFPCGRRWAEMEAFISHRKPKPSPAAYIWLFAALGSLHRALARLNQPVPRPLVATYAAPATLQRWLGVTEPAVRAQPAATQTIQRVHELVRRLRQQWVPATDLPLQLVHGDVRLGNLGRTPGGEVAYLDFGFLARRPRVHDLAYSLAYMVLALHRQRPPGQFGWGRIAQLIEAYESAAGWRLTRAERQALGPYAAAVPIYHAAIAGFTRDSARQLRTALPFLSLSAWLLENPEVTLA